MRVLMIAPEPFFEPRGTPISIYQRIRALSSLSHQVDLVTYHVGKDVDFRGLSIYRIPNVPFIKKVKIGPSWAKPILDIFLFLTAFRLLLVKRYDLIHSHEEAAFFAMFLSALFRTPHLYDMHSILSKQLENFAFGNWWWLVKMFELLERSVLHTCDAVITIGYDLEDYVHQVNRKVRRLTIENVRVRITNNQGEHHLLNKLKTELRADGKRPIVYTGTIEQYQGLDILIDCVRLVVQQFPGALFIIVGGKPEQIEKTKIEVIRQKIGESVIFTGVVNPDEALDYLDLAEVLVSPRIAGTSVPLKIYSYLHAGRPIVATNIPAHTQVLNKDVAVLVEPNKEALADGICVCLSDPEYSQQLGLRALNLAQQRYSYDNYLSKVKNIYDTFEPASLAQVQMSESPEN